MKKGFPFLSRVPALALLALLLHGAQLISAAPKKKTLKPKEPVSEEGKSYKAPPWLKKPVIIYSPLDDGAIRQIVEFLNDATGLACRRLPPKEGRAYPDDEPFDLYLGPLPNAVPRTLRPYDSPKWKGYDPSLHRNGLFTWSTWYSCLVLNTLIPVERDKLETNALGALFGKLTAIDPRKDMHTNAILSALRTRYGNEVVRDIAAAIPVYMATGEELVFAVESGRYAAALGVEGGFRSSLARGYPLEINFGSLNASRYPVASVRGKNVAFISASAPNREGAEFLVDFLAEEAFQSFLAATPFVPLKPDLMGAGAPRRGFPAAVVDWVYDAADMGEVRRLWEGFAFPEGVEELIR